MSFRLSTRRTVGLLAFGFVFVVCSLCPAQNFPGAPHPNSPKAAKNGAPPAVSAGSWAQLAKLVAPNFYASVIDPGVAISGDTAVMSEGAIKGFHKNAVADVFVKTGQGWQNTAPVATLTAPEPEEPYIAPVAIDGDTVVVAGAVGFDGIAGYVFVYVKPPGGWHKMFPTAMLTPSDTNDTAFGDSVSISGDTIVVGDNGYSGYTSGLGAAYVYVKPKGGWHSMTETAKLTASDGINTDLFGYSVSISGGTIVVGATQSGSFLNPGTGKAYVFVKPSAGWTSMTQTAELTATGLANGDVFGSSVAVDGNVVVVGSSGYNGYVGAAFVYQKPASGWTNMTQTAMLTSGDGFVGGVASSVAISGNIVIAGAPYRGFTPNTDEGAVYAFEEPAGGWQNMTSNTVLIGSDAHYNNSFGYFVGISGKTVVGSAQFRLQAPAAYVFGLP
jgi:FG-GAP repeat